MLYALLLFFFVVVAAFLTSAETALSYCSHVRVKARAGEGHRGARRCERLLHFFDHVLVALFLSIHVVYAAVASVATLLFRSVLTENAPISLVASLVTTLVIFFFCECIPKNIARERATELSILYSLPILLLVLILTPITALISLFAVLAKKLFARHKEAHITTEELADAIDDALSEGELPREERELLHAALAFSECKCEKAMLPLTNISMLAADTPTDIAKTFLQNAPESRIPLYAGERTNIVGFVHVERYLLAYLRAGSPPPLSDFLEIAPQVLTTDHISDALALLREQNATIAVVTDGERACGILTVETITGQVVDVFSDTAGGVQ